MADISIRSERRRIARRRTLLSGKVVFNGTSSTLNCTVRNLTELGGRLLFPSAVGIPEQFQLKIMAQAPVACVVIWKSGNERGIAFEPKPTPQ